MEAFHQCVALGPVALYLIVLGIINLSRRPRMLTGGHDAVMLALAVSGLVLIGPFALLFPGTIAAHFGQSGTRFIWLILVVLYALLLVLRLLTMRPRLIVFNITATRLRPVLADLVANLDPDARWAGDSLALPRLGVQLHIEYLVWMRNVSLISSGSKQDIAGWNRLAVSLRAALKQMETTPNPRGATLLSVGTAMLLALIWSVTSDPHAFAKSVLDLMK